MSDIDHEDRLRRALLAEADQVQPAGDGLARIQQRVADRRARLRWLRPLAAAAVVAGVAGAATLAVQLTGSTSRQTIGVTQHPTPTPSATPPAPTPVVAPPALALWPAAATTASWQRNPSSTALRFVGSFLGMKALDQAPRMILSTEVTTQDSANATATTATVDVGRAVGGQFRAVTRVRLVERAGRWYVTSAAAPDVSIASPVAGAGVGSPVRAAGRLVGVDVGLHVQLFAPAMPGAPIASTTKTTGTGGWTVDLPYAPTGDAVGALAAWTDSAVDGQPAQLSVVAVRLTAAAPAYPAYFVATDSAAGSGRVGVFSSLNGAPLRWLTSGTSDFDPQLTADGHWVYYLHRTGSCTTELLRQPFDGGTPQAVASGAGDLLFYGLGQNGNLLAYVTTRYCAAGTATTVVAKNLSAGTSVTIETAKGNAGPPVVIGNPAWSPDGSQLAVPENPGMQQTNILVYDPATGQVRYTVPCLLPGSCRTSFPAYDTAGRLVIQMDNGSAAQVDRYAGHMQQLYPLPSPWSSTDSFSLAPDGASALWVQLTPSGAERVYRWTGGPPTSLDTSTPVYSVSW